jgi:hypothetical protein
MYYDSQDCGRAPPYEMIKAIEGSGPIEIREQYEDVANWKEMILDCRLSRRPNQSRRAEGHYQNVLFSKTARMPLSCKHRRVSDLLPHIFDTLPRGFDHFAVGQFP